MGLTGWPGFMRPRLRGLLVADHEVAPGQPDPGHAPGLGGRPGRDAGLGGRPGQGLDQGAVRQPQRGPSRLRRHADGQRVAPGVRGDHLGELAAQLAPAGRIGEPAAGHRRRAAGRPHGRYRAGPQQAVPPQQVGNRGQLGPGGQLPACRRGRAAPRECGRCHVEHRGTQDRDAGAARVAEQDPVPHVQRERLPQHQPDDGVSRSGRAQQPDPGCGPGRADVQRHFLGQPELGVLAELSRER